MMKNLEEKMEFRIIAERAMKVHWDGIETYCLLKASAVIQLLDELDDKGVFIYKALEVEIERSRERKRLIELLKVARLVNQREWPNIKVPLLGLRREVRSCADIKTEDAT